MVKNEQAGAVAGVLGTVVSCSAMMFSLFPALLGTIGASASTSMMGMSTTATLPPWVNTITHYSPIILGISIILIIYAIRRAALPVKIVVGIGILLLILNEISMTPYLFLPALVLVIVGNIMGWKWRSRISGIKEV